jgi:hypothetical protein
VKDPNAISIQGIDDVILPDSYVANFVRRDGNVVLEMDFKTVRGEFLEGNIVFPAVTFEQWWSRGGAVVSLEEINLKAQRFFGGPAERSDLGTINEIQCDGVRWVLIGDWGKTCLISAAPFVSYVGAGAA